MITEALLHAFQNQVADIIAAVPGRAGDSADGFAITAVQSEGYAQFGAVLAAELKAVRAPTRIAGFHGKMEGPTRAPSLRKMLRSSLLELANAFRSAVETVLQTGKVPVHIQGFLRGRCGIISELMGDYFNSLDVGEFFYVCGTKEGASHAWLEIDGLTVDITGNQFPGRPSVYVDTPDAWYGEWEHDTKHLAIHDQNAFFYGEERQFLERVLEHIKKAR